MDFDKSHFILFKAQSKQNKAAMLRRKSDLMPCDKKKKNNKKPQQHKFHQTFSLSLSLPSLQPMTPTQATHHLPSWSVQTYFRTPRQNDPLFKSKLWATVEIKKKSDKIEKSVKNNVEQQCRQIRQNCLWMDFHLHFYIIFSDKCAAQQLLRDSLPCWLQADTTVNNEWRHRHRENPFMRSNPRPMFTSLSSLASNVLKVWVKRTNKNVHVFSKRQLLSTLYGT